MTGDDHWCRAILEGRQNGDKWHDRGQRRTRVGRTPSPPSRRAANAPCRDDTPGRGPIHRMVRHRPVPQRHQTCRTGPKPPRLRRHAERPTVTRRLLAEPVEVQGRDWMRHFLAFGLLLLAGCATTAPYGGTSARPPASSDLSTMRQITGRTEGLETLQPETGNIWAVEPSAKPPSSRVSAQPRGLRAAAPQGEAPLAPPSLSHAEGDFWQIPELGSSPRS